MMFFLGEISQLLNTEALKSTLTNTNINIFNVSLVSTFLYFIYSKILTCKNLTETQDVFVRSLIFILFEKQTRNQISKDMWITESAFFGWIANKEFAYVILAIYQGVKVKDS